MTDITERATKWIVSGDTGISSKTIWAVMMGTEPDHSGYPLDNDDFGRCYRLLARIPEWEPRLPEVAKAYPSWAPLVERWGELKALYEADLETKDSHKCHELLRDLYRECMTADGFVEVVPGFWQRKQETRR